MIDYVKASLKAYKSTTGNFTFISVLTEIIGKTD